MKFTVSILVSLCLSLLAEGQSNIVYGSNNGTYFSIFNTKIYYEEYGKGTPLLLLQGGMGSIADFKLCIPELSKRFRVILPDTPGQGRSELADSMSYPLLAKYMAALIDQLQLDSTYVMGWSDGGIIGLLLAEGRPDKVRKVIAVGANYNLAGTNLRNVKPTPSVEWERRNKDWIANYIKMLSRDWKKYYRDAMHMWYQPEYFSPDILKRINIPVLIAQGDRDLIRIEHALEMHRMIKNSQFCVLPNTSHAVFRERPKLINQIAVEFFSHEASGGYRARAGGRQTA
jgi:pimeloyl-ACP methyl ester carboxylesterase